MEGNELREDELFCYWLTKMEETLQVLKFTRESKRKYCHPLR